MIAIVNVSKCFGQGMQDYEVRINDETITRFRHRRDDGRHQVAPPASEAGPVPLEELCGDRALQGSEWVWVHR